MLVLRGDARHADSGFIPTPGGHAYATNLLQQVVDMNNGIYVHEDHDTTFKTRFCIGVSGYPESLSKLVHRYFYTISNPGPAKRIAEAIF